MSIDEHSIIRLKDDSLKCQKAEQEATRQRASQQAAQAAQATRNTQATAATTRTNTGVGRANTNANTNTYVSPTQSNVYYRNCSEVRAAGRAPLYRGQPGYSTKLDRDRDGIACE